MKSYFSKISRKKITLVLLGFSCCLIAFLAAVERSSDQESHFFWPINDHAANSSQLNQLSPKIQPIKNNPFEEETTLAQEGEIPEEEFVESSDPLEEELLIAKDAEDYPLFFEKSEDEPQEILTSEFLVYDQNRDPLFDQVDVQASLVPDEFVKDSSNESVGYTQSEYSAISTPPRAGSVSPFHQKQVASIGNAKEPEVFPFEETPWEVDDVQLAQLMEEDSFDEPSLNYIPEASLDGVRPKVSVVSGEAKPNNIGPTPAFDYSPGSRHPKERQTIASSAGTPGPEEKSTLEGTEGKIKVLAVKTQKPAPIGVGHPEYEPFFPAGFNSPRMNSTSIASQTGRSHLERDSLADLIEDHPKDFEYLSADLGAFKLVEGSEKQNQDVALLNNATNNLKLANATANDFDPNQSRPEKDNSEDPNQERPNMPPAEVIASVEKINLLESAFAQTFIITQPTIPEYLGPSKTSLKREENLPNPGSKGPWPSQDLAVQGKIGKSAPEKPLLALAPLLAQDTPSIKNPFLKTEQAPEESTKPVKNVEKTESPIETPIDLKATPQTESVVPKPEETEKKTSTTTTTIDTTEDSDREPGSTQGVVTTTSPSQPTTLESTVTPPPTAREGFLINFSNVSIVEYINFISKITGKNFIFDPGDLNFKVTIVSNEPTSVNNIMSALLQELRIHDLSLMEVGNNLIIHRNPNANAPATVVTEGAPNIRNQELITRVYHLTNTSAEQIVPVLKPMLSSFALVEAVENSGHLIVTDLTSNIEKISVLVKSLDAPSADLVIGQFHVSYASAEEVVALADKILAPIAQGKPLTFVPHTPTNSVFIISTPYLVEKAISILHQVDVPQGQGTTRILSSVPPSSVSPSILPEDQRSPEGLESGRLVPEPPTGQTNAGRWTSNLPLGHVESTRFFIRKLQYRKGDQIVEALRRVGDSLQFSGGISPEAAIQNTDLITTINSIQWLEASNSLIYTGTIDSITRVTQLVDEIDIPVRQVLVEMLILETNIDDSLAFSVDWGSRFGGLDTAGSQAFLNQGSPLVTALDTTQVGQNPNASGLARSAGFNLGVIGRRLTHNGQAFQSLGLLVSALHADLRQDVVMNPKVVVEDNTPAEVFVGLEARFQTQTIANDFGTILTSNFEYRDVGATLRVTPLIGSDDMITLDVEMEISTLITDALIPGSNVVNQTAAVLLQANLVQVVPVERKSKTISKIHLPNKYFVILSGMLQEELDRVRNNLPCLGGVPIIGAAFSNKSTRNIRRNIMLFIRPQIIEPEDIDPVTKRQQDILREKNRQTKAWQYEVDEALYFFNLKHMCDPDEPEDVMIR
jgi:type III secretion protein C